MLVRLTRQLQPEGLPMFFNVATPKESYIENIYVGTAEHEALATLKSYTK